MKLHKYFTKNFGEIQYGKHFFDGLVSVIKLAVVRL